jgi:hypothetical protein
MKRLIGVHLKDIVKDTKSEKSKSVKQAVAGRKDKEPVTRQNNAVIDASMYGRCGCVSPKAQMPFLISTFLSGSKISRMQLRRIQLL